MNERDNSHHKTTLFLDAYVYNTYILYIYIEKEMPMNSMNSKLQSQ